jgi:hypothetical protein
VAKRDLPHKKNRTCYGGSKGKRYGKDAVVIKRPGYFKALLPAFCPQSVGLELRKERLVQAAMERIKPNDIGERVVVAARGVQETQQEAIRRGFRERAQD